MRFEVFLRGSMWQGRNALRAIGPEVEMFRLSVLAHPLGARILKRCVRTALFFLPVAGGVDAVHGFGGGWI